MDWRLWAGLLVGVYAVVGLIGFQRTLTPDEIRPLLLAAGPWREQLEFARQDLVNTPASYFLTRLWLQLVGHTDTGAKMFALLVNVPTLVLFTVLARRMTSYWPVASLLCAAVYLRVGGTPNLVRMYGLLLLCIVAAILLWLRWRERPSAGLLVAWLAVMVLAVCMHASALLTLPAFVIGTWLYGPAQRLFTVAAALVALALLPWLVFVGDVYADRGFDANVGWIQDNPTKAVAELPFLVLSGEDPGADSPLGEKYRTRGIPAALKWLALLLHVALFTFATPRLLAAGPPHRARDEIARSFWTAALFAAVPVAVLYLFSITIAPVVHARYLLVALPGYLLLVTVAARLGGQPARGVLAVIAIWVLGSAGTALALNLEPSAARRGVALLNRELCPSDVVVVERHMPLGWEIQWEWTRRLRRQEPIVILTVDWTPHWLGNIVPGVDLDKLDVRHAERVWFIHRDHRRVQEFRAHLAEQGFEPAPFEGAFAAVDLFERPARASSIPSSITQ